MENNIINRYGIYQCQSLVTILIVIIMLGLNFCYITAYNITPVFASSGEPPVNGTTTDTWYISDHTVRRNEWINTSNIQINDTASMDWHNIIAQINGDIIVNSTGYFNITNSTIILNGNLSNFGMVTLRNVHLKMNCSINGEYSITVFGTLYIHDWDKNELTTNDRTVVENGTTDNKFMITIKKDSSFEMLNSRLTHCGWGGSNRGLTIQANNTVIKNCVLIGNDNAIVLESPSSGNEIIGNSIQNSGTGILMDSSNKNNVSGNTISNCYYGILASQASGNNITHNTITSSTTAIEFNSASYNKVSSNTLNNNNLDGIELLGSTYNFIDHNTVSNNGDDGIDVDLNSDYNIISNNTANSNEFGTMLTNADHNFIYNNSYSNNVNVSVGVYLSSTKNRIEKNRCTGGTLGIASLMANDNQYLYNTITSNYGGVALSSSSNNDILYNQITSNTLAGIGLNSSSANNEVHYNTITGHFLYGIYVDDAGSLVNATYNWWGSWSGPKHATTNPSGTGDTVTNYVLYRPWGLYNVPPTIDVLDKTSIAEDSYYEKTYSGSDKNGDTLTWNVTTNASWLQWGENNITLFGYTSNAFVGVYWVRVNLSDGVDGYDEHYFNLTVTNIEPIIKTTNINIAKEEVYYYNDYDSTDDGSGTITWGLETGAGWLTLDPITGVLNGTPGNSDVGELWVNISVDDGFGALTWTKFILIVQNTNDPPVITSGDNHTATEDALYNVQYQAIDIDPTNDVLTWGMRTDAKWLNLGQSTGQLSGTPENKDVGEYWINISVSDGNGGIDWSNFSLTVINVNDPPMITTTDIEIIQEDILYYTDYNATDLDPTNDVLTWQLATNAKWLGFDTTTGVLSGVADSVDVGEYWVNVSVSDGQGGIDWHNFTLEVVSIGNEQPVISTINIITAKVGKLYTVTYSATDDLTPASELEWTMNTNASWLTFDKVSHTLSGTPQVQDIGTCWVKITVTDEHGAYSFTNFTITVTQDVVPNNTPNLANAGISPSSGNTETEFTFSVTYTDADNDPGDVMLWLDGQQNSMNPDPNDNDYTDGVKYTFQTILTKGKHSYYFTASDGRSDAVTTDNTPLSPSTAWLTPDVEEIKDDKSDDDGEAGPDLTLYLIILIVVIIIILVLAFIFKGKKDNVTTQDEMIEE